MVQSRPTTPVLAADPAATTPETPETRATELSRDDRIRVQLLNYIGWNYQKIADLLDCTLHQVRYAMKHRFTPQKVTTGNGALLNTPRRKTLVEWIKASPTNRHRRWVDIPKY